MAGKNTDDSNAGDETGALQAEAVRLSTALDGLDKSVSILLERLQGMRDSGETDQDRARLAAELDSAQARADALEDAAREAGAALDSAIAEVRDALGEV